MDIEDPDKTTTHIKTDTKKLQKRLNKKINTKDNLTENETTQAIKSRHKSNSRTEEKEDNQKPTSKPPIETKKLKNLEQMEIEINSIPPIKKLGQLRKHRLLLAKLEEYLSEQ